MNIDQATLARRLRDARERANITQEEAATALTVQRTAIVQIEAGNRAVSSLELARLAKLYHRDFSDFFAESDPAEVDPFLVLHRLAPGLEQDALVRSEVNHCLEICSEGADLEDLLGQTPRVGPPAYNLPSPHNAGEAVSQGEQVAAFERQRLGLNDAPITDLADLLSSQNVWASAVRLPDQMSGLFLRHPKIGMVILVNHAHHWLRKRFSYAHEYAHALLDRDRDGTVSTKDNASELIEKRANAFAAAFLMPAGGVIQSLRSLDKGQPSRVEQSIFDVATEGRIDTQLRPEPGSQVMGYQDVIRIADRFRASYRATVYRLQSLSVISGKDRETLLAQEKLANEFRQVLDPDYDPGPGPEQRSQDRELIGQVARLAIEAYRREEISRGRLLELSDVLALDRKRLLSLAEAARSA